MLSQSYSRCRYGLPFLGRILPGSKTMPKHGSILRNFQVRKEWRPNIRECLLPDSCGTRRSHRRKPTPHRQDSARVFLRIIKHFQSCITDFVRSAHAYQLPQGPFDFPPIKARLVDNSTNYPEKMLIFFADHND